MAHRVGVPPVAPPTAMANPDTIATPSAARLATPNTYIQEAT